MAEQRQLVMNAINAREFSVSRDVDGHLILKDNRFPFAVVCVTCHLEARKLCHGCGKVRQMDARASYCATCQTHQREGMDLAFRDDNFDQC